MNQEKVKRISESLNRRRDIELKYNFGLWGAIGVVHYHLVSTQPSYVYSAAILISYVFAFALYTAISLKFWHSNDLDHRKISYYDEDNDDEINPKGPFACLFKNTFWWHVIYVVFTGSILFGSFDLVLQKLQNPCNVTVRCCRREVACSSLNNEGCLLIWFVLIVIVFLAVCICETSYLDNYFIDKKARCMRPKRNSNENACPSTPR